MVEIIRHLAVALLMAICMMSSALRNAVAESDHERERILVAEHNFRPFVAEYYGVNEPDSVAIIDTSEVLKFALDKIIYVAETPLIFRNSVLRQFKSQTILGDLTDFVASITDSNWVVEFDQSTTLEDGSFPVDKLIAIMELMINVEGIRLYTPVELLTTLKSLLAAQSQSYGGGAVIWDRYSSRLSNAFDSASIVSAPHYGIQEPVAEEGLDGIDISFSILGSRSVPDGRAYALTYLVIVFDNGEFFVKVNELVLSE